jgi:hypothetical protein
LPFITNLFLIPLISVVILNTLQELQSQAGQGRTISITKVLKELKDVVIEEFDPTGSLDAYKDLWSNRISSVATENGFLLVCQLHFIWFANLPC